MLENRFSVGAAQIKMHIQSLWSVVDVRDVSAVWPKVPASVQGRLCSKWVRKLIWGFAERTCPDT